MVDETTMSVHNAAMRARSVLMKWVERKRDLRELPTDRLDVWELGYVSGGIQAALQSLHEICDLDDSLLCRVYYDERGDIDGVDLNINVRLGA